MKYTDQEKAAKAPSKPVIKDSTLGGDNYGLQGLANRIAAKRAGQTPPQPVQHFYTGGPVMPPLDLGGAGFDVNASASTAPVAMAGAPASIPQAVQDAPVDADSLPVNALGSDPSLPQQPTPPPSAPTPSAPPIGQVAAALNQTPPTDYSFYQPGMTAEDRMALQQKLIAAQNSPGQMVAQGLAGLGDAVSNSFGGRSTTFQKDVMANNEATQKKQLGALDTGREQKMQDMQANLEMQKNDPRSPLSQSMQKTFKAAGINVPSGMPASVMMSIAPALGELAMKQATLAMQQQQVNATVANQDASRRVEAAGKLQERSAPRKAWEALTGDSDETKLLRQEVNEGNSSVHNTGGQAPQPSSGVPGFVVGQPVKLQNGVTITKRS